MIANIKLMDMDDNGWFLFRILQFVVMKIAMCHEMSVDYVRIVVDDFLLDCS